MFVHYFGCLLCTHCLQDLYELDLFTKPAGVGRTLPKPMDSDSEDADAADAGINCEDEAAAPSHSSSRTFAVQSKCASKVNKLLDVQRYSNRWPKIPMHKLFASSIQHPYVQEWR